MAKNTGSSAFRKIDIDQFNEDNYKEDDGLDPQSPVGPDEQEITLKITQYPFTKEIFKPVINEIIVRYKGRFGISQDNRVLLPPYNLNSEATGKYTEAVATVLRAAPIGTRNQAIKWNDPTVFLRERGEDSQRWLSDFQCMARYNKWDDSMCLANVIFYLTGTAKCWFENFEEILNSLEKFR
ncbi:ARPC5 [Cordylochernes scorpioides]|uniref:ARPC5 n=1 Tax=Cordylochernes scorpioides TaxID=51811 RepID=A0ABY6KMK0_9ARAC|nr:ARPC5 [Cordylochernes scorpioides]